MVNDIPFFSAPICKYEKKYIFAYIVFICLNITGVCLSLYLIDDESLCCGDVDVIRMVLCFFVFFISFLISRYLCVYTNKTYDSEYLYVDNQYYN